MKEQKILVVGGCGYIGSHVTRMLTEAGHSAVVYDGLSTGHREALLHKEPLTVGDVHDKVMLEKVFNDHRIETVYHFAASIITPESVEQPLKYYFNNTCGTIALPEVCQSRSVKNFIFPALQRSMAIHKAALPPRRLRRRRSIPMATRSCSPSR